MLRGIRGLLEKIDGRLEDHGRRLTDIETKTTDERGKGKEKEIVDQEEKGKEEENFPENEDDDSPFQILRIQFEMTLFLHLRSLQKSRQFRVLE